MRSYMVIIENTLERYMRTKWSQKLGQGSALQRSTTKAVNISHRNGMVNYLGKQAKN